MKRPLRPAVIDGLLVGLSQYYADGRQRTEFYFRREFTPLFDPIKVGQRITIRLKVGEAMYAAGLRLCERTGCVYICPNLVRTPGDSKRDLAATLAAVGIGPRQKAAFRLLPGELRYYAASTTGRPKRRKPKADAKQRTDLGYGSLKDLITNRLVHDEESETAELMARLRPARERGYLTKDEFTSICRWKSPRPRRWYTTNTDDAVIAATREALSTRHERRKIELLTRLKGVEIPTASAILTLTDPERYGVIDIRVWKVLYRFGAVRDNPKGQNFTLRQWHTYLRTLRALARTFKTTARNVERTLFEYHKTIQEGTLYSGAPSASRRS